MSYGVSVTYPAVTSENFNYTYNCGPMFDDVLPGGINGLHGLAAPEALERIKVALEKMHANPEKYRAMNPPNGWGDYHGAMTFLHDIKSACLRHPDGTLDIS
jgi:hypothetical protein